MISNNSLEHSRRAFLASAAAAAGAVMVPRAIAAGGAKYTRPNMTSASGKMMLGIYAKGVEAMLKLPASHPQNWLRNAFVHLLDCPHGNWWFYAWHRGYIGFLERTIREVTGEKSFALPYWDWTQSPQLADELFQGVLTPTNAAYSAYTSNLAVFSSFLKQPIADYLNTLSPAQVEQLVARGYHNGIDDIWNDVTGYSKAEEHGISGNQAFAPTFNSRFLSQSNAKLDDKTAQGVSPFVVYAGLLPTDFYSTEKHLSFTSSKTPSHNTPPSGATSFSVLEAQPHNLVHNCIGGVGPLDPGPYGNMANFLSPVDPVFFLHHANIDRLWDVWSRKQIQLGLPHLPTGQDLDDLNKEPFLFFVDGDGTYVQQSTAADYMSMSAFDYDYEPGFGELIVKPKGSPVVKEKSTVPVAGNVAGNTGTVVVPRAMLDAALMKQSPRQLFVSVTLSRDTGDSAGREFDVLVNAPDAITSVSADSPYYAGTVAFFGPTMSGMKMSSSASFVVPLPTKLGAFKSLGNAKTVTIAIRVVPSGKYGAAPSLQRISLGVAQ